MIIRSFCVENFGCYRDRVCIQFVPPQNGRNLYLIGGMNGHGKTTLSNALQVCLFGIQGQPRLIADYVNRVNRREGKNDVFLKLEFEEDDETYVVQRRYYTRGWAQGTWDVQVRVEANGHCYEGDDAENVIHQIFPPDIADFFLFDGEEIKNLADKTEEDTAHQIGESLEAILGLRILGMLQQDLEKVQNDYAREGSSESYALLRSLEKQCSDLEDEAESHRDRMESIRTELQRVNRDIEKRTQELNKVRDAYECYTDLKGKLQQLQSQLEQTLSRLRMNMSERLPFALVATYLEQFLIASEQSARFRLQQQAHRVIQQRLSELMKRLRENAECICGRSLSSNSLNQVEQFLLTHLLEQSTSGEDSASQPAAVGTLPVLRETEVAVLHDHLKQAVMCEDVVKLARELSRLYDEAKAVKEQLESLGDLGDQSKTLAELEQIVRELSERKGALETEFRTLKQRVDKEIPTQLERARSQMQRIRDEVIRSDKARKAERLAGRTRELLEELLQAVRSQKIAMLEKHVTETFRRLWTKGELLDRIEIIPETFAVSVVQRDGAKLDKQALSAGEKELFALSLLAGLSKCASSTLPVLIDTPLGRLDSEHRERIVRYYYPYLAPQVILLSTDTEVTQDLYQVLLPHVCQAFTLEYDLAKESTSIRKGFFDFDI